MTDKKTRDMDNQTPKILAAAEAADTNQRQNLQTIRYISADRSGSIDAVLSTLRACEKLQLTPEQLAIGADMVQSINEHDSERALAACYLIRYGMLLERGGRE